MYRYMKGQIVSIKDDHCLLEVQGIGYQIHLAPNYAVKLPAKEVMLHISFVIREFSQALYGFLQESERDIFETLLDISGIGPKLALSIIGHLPPSELKLVLLNKDVQALVKVPGIGKKTAERLMLELKGSALNLIQIDTQQVSVKHPPLLEDAISALVNLGYSQQAASRAVTKTYESYENELCDISELITDSLRNI